MRLTLEVTDDILKAGYIASMEAPLIEKYIKDVSFEEYKYQLKEYEIWGITNDRPVGVIFFDGTSVHISILKEYFGKCGFVIRRALAIALRKYGSLIAIIDHGDIKTKLLVEKLKFKQIGMTNDFAFYFRG